MRKFFISLLLVLVFSSSAFSQAKIRKECRVPNKDPGYCAWACLATLGRHQKIKVLYNLVEDREKEFTWEWNESKRVWVKSPYLWVDYGSYKNWEHRGPASHVSVRNKLNSLGVRYRSVDNYDLSLINESVKNKQGCLIVVKCFWETSNNNHFTHAIVIINYDDKGVEYIDPNDIDYVYTATHEWFNYYWTGYSLILDKK